MKLLMAWCLVLCLAYGCSIYKAATAPPPVPVELVKAGSSRADVISVFGRPTGSGKIDRQQLETFEFIDGSSTGSKGRVLLYLAGDLVTLGLAELVFWPMESVLMQGSKGRAIVVYGPDLIVRSVSVTRKDASPWTMSAQAEDKTDFER